MMHIAVNNTIFDIEDKYVDYSPFLGTLKTTKVNTKKLEYDDIEAYVVEDVDPYHMKQYLLFLMGNDFDFNEDIAAAFDYFGHPNEMEYPLDYWKVKLQDRWIRDNFYKYELYKDPLYGLVEVPVKYPRDLNTDTFKYIKRDKWYIAGGIVLHMAGGTDTYNDIDIFTTEEDINAINKVIMKDFAYGDKVYATKNSVTRSSFQLILRRYKSPSEIVHGFDVDCCGFILVGDRIYATKRAKYAMDNKVNYFDPERSSPSYINRLIKYHWRGYAIQLPLIEQAISDSMILSYLRRRTHNKLLWCSDKITTLILTARANLYVCMRTNCNHDYGSEPKLTKISQLQWKEQNPMEQVSSTFYPEPIKGDLVEWYNKCTIVTGEKEEKVYKKIKHTTTLNSYQYDEYDDSD